MQRVEVVLEFTLHCLGNRRGQTIDRFSRNPDGKVIFMNSYWQALLVFGANDASKAQGLVRKVFFAPEVEGEVKIYNRHWRNDRYTPHEAFLAGSRIKVKAAIPAGMTPADLRGILEKAGEFKGISPYGHDKGWGKFKVISVERT